jgi:hypothetical protein
MPAGVPDAPDLVEVRLRTGTEPTHERLECLGVGSILRLELAQFRLGAAQHELSERRGFRAEACAQWLERSGERRSLGDRVSRVRRRHSASVAPCSTGPVSSDQADFITGQPLSVSSGLTIA